MDRDFLKPIFGKCPVLVEYGGGKKLCIYYSKSKYLAIPIDECVTDSEIKNKIGRLKRILYGVVNLMTWVKKNKTLNDSINEFLSEYFMYSMEFSISFNNKIVIRYAGEKTVIDPHNINDDIKKDPVTDVILRAAESRNDYQSMKYIKTYLPEAILKKTGNKFVYFYGDILKSSNEWASFSDKIKHIYSAYSEFKKYMRADGFPFVNENRDIELAENIIRTLNTDEYSIFYDGDGILFYLDNMEMFRLTANGVETVYDDCFKEIFHSLRLVWKVHYDIRRTICPYSTKNVIFRIDENGKLWIHTLSDCMVVNECEKAVLFVRNKAEKIREIKEGTLEGIGYAALLSLNSIGFLKQCMDIYELVSFNEFFQLCRLSGVLEQDFIASFYAIPNLLATLKQKEIVSCWSLFSNGSCEVEFTDYGKKLLDYVCIEAEEFNESMLSQLGLSFSEMTLIMPESYIKQFLKNKKAVELYTKEIIQLMDSRAFSVHYTDELISALSMFNRKYLPLLKLKASAGQAKEKLGARLFIGVKSFFENN